MGAHLWPDISWHEVEIHWEYSNPGLSSTPAFSGTCSALYFPSQEKTSGGWIIKIKDMFLKKSSEQPIFAKSRKHYPLGYLKSVLKSFTWPFFRVQKPMIVDCFYVSLFFIFWFPSHSWRHASWTEVIWINVLKISSIYFEVNNILLSLGG